MPAALPTVVSVGGTSLKLNENGTRNSETVWNDNGPRDEVGLETKKRKARRGGGCSTLFTAPPWQQNVAGWAATGCGTKRLDNDIAAVADPYTGFDIYDSYNCGRSCEEHGGGEGWETIGGTSLSSPIVAAIYALAGGGGGVSYPAATLYSHLGQSSALYDVTEGGNGYCDGERRGRAVSRPSTNTYGSIDCEGTTACDAAAGFDGPSGVGTPKGLGGFKSNAVTLVTQTSATLNARVNPDGQNGHRMRVRIRRRAPTYGSSAPCTLAAGVGVEPGGGVRKGRRVSPRTPNTTSGSRRRAPPARSKAPT